MRFREQEDVLGAPCEKHCRMPAVRRDISEEQRDMFSVSVWIAISLPVCASSGSSSSASARSALPRWGRDRNFCPLSFKPIAADTNRFDEARHFNVRSGIAVRCFIVVVCYALRPFIPSVAVRRSPLLVRCALRPVIPFVISFAFLSKSAACFGFFVLLFLKFANFSAPFLPPTDACYFWSLVYCSLLVAAAAAK